MKATVVLAGFVVFTLLGNFFFKRGAMELAPISMAMPTLWSAIASVNVWCGVITYGIAAVCWFVAMSLVPLNLAITVSSCIYPIVVVMAAVVFNEPIPLVRWVGVGMIFGGLVVVGRTA